MPKFSAPVYRLHAGLFVALDANHRLAALTLVGKECAVELDEVDGPFDSNCLADIAALSKSPIPSDRLSDRGDR